jgi:hypothetical protein
MDDLIASAAVSSRTLTMPSFMDNILMQLEPIKTKGVFFSPVDGDRKLPACATRDIAPSPPSYCSTAPGAAMGTSRSLAPKPVLQ